MADPLEWPGKTLVDAEGVEIGRIADIYSDDATSEPEWATVLTGAFGSRASFVPLAGASADGNRVRTSYTKRQVHDAPNVEAEDHLSESREAELYAHYGLSYTGDRGPGETSPGRTGAGGTGSDDTGLADGEQAEMVLAEERLRVDNERRTAGRLRLRKVVDVDPVVGTVPVGREQVVIQRLLINQELPGDPSDRIGEAEFSVAVHDERLVIDTETVARERIRVDTRTQTEALQVSDSIRRERLEVETERTKPRPTTPADADAGDPNSTPSQPPL